MIEWTKKFECQWEFEIPGLIKVAVYSSSIGGRACIVI